MIPSFAAQPDPVGRSNAPWLNWAVAQLGRGSTGRFDGGAAATYTSGSGDVHQWPVHARASRHRAVAQLARVPVSKTGGWGFESLLPCEYGPCAYGRMAAPAES